MIQLTKKAQCRFSLVCLAVMLQLSVSACAPISAAGVKPPESAANEHNDLYTGKSTAAFATEFTPQSAAEAEALAQMALEQANLDKALFHYVQVLGFEPRNAEALNKIGAIHRHRGNSEHALSAYQRVLEFASTNTQALTGAGMLLVEQRDFTQAVDYLTRSIEHNPAQWQAHNALGIVRDLQRKHREAQGHFSAALKYQPGSALVYNNFGYSYYLDESWRDAALMYRRALEIDPNYARAWRNLGLLHLRRGDSRAALDAMSHTMERAEAYNDLGYLSMLEGNYALSQQLLERAIDESASYYKVANENLSRLRALREEQALGDEGS